MVAALGALARNWHDEPSVAKLIIQAGRSSDRQIRDAVAIPTSPSQ
jgi:hypothetical protein